MNRIIPRTQESFNPIKKILRDIDNLFFQIKKQWAEINDLKFRYSKEEEAFYKDIKSCGKKVKLNIWGGLEMEGSITKVDKYCIFLMIGEKTILVHKSAVAYIEII
jgi:sRNA-binding regulator protein Hfq